MYLIGLIHFEIFLVKNSFSLFKLVKKKELKRNVNKFRVTYLAGSYQAFFWFLRRAL